MSTGMLCHVDWYIAADFGWLVLPLSLGSSTPRKSRNARPTKRNTCGRPRNLFSSGVCLYLTKHVVASKCIRNHFVSEKYKTVETFKLYFLKNSPLLQPYTTASDCKSVAYVPGSHFVKAFSGLPPHS